MILNLDSNKLLNSLCSFTICRPGKRTLGAAGTRIRRIVPSAYADNKDVPRGGFTPAG